MLGPQCYSILGPQQVALRLYPICASSAESAFSIAELYPSIKRAGIYKRYICILGRGPPGTHSDSCFFFFARTE